MAKLVAEYMSFAHFFIW